MGVIHAMAVSTALLVMMVMPVLQGMYMTPAVTVLVCLLIVMLMGYVMPTIFVQDRMIMWIPIWTGRPISVMTVPIPPLAIVTATVYVMI